MTSGLAAVVAKVLAVAWCREAHPDLGLVPIPNDPDPRLHIAACFQCQRRAAHVAAEVTNALTTQLAEIDRNARAYGWEIGRGHPLTEQIESTDPLNPFLAADWRAAIPEALGVCPPDCERDHAPCSRNRWTEAAEALGAGEAETEGNYCLTCASYQCEHAHATYGEVSQ